MGHSAVCMSSYVGTRASCPCITPRRIRAHPRKSAASSSFRYVPLDWLRYLCGVFRVSRGFRGFWKPEAIPYNSFPYKRFSLPTYRKWRHYNHGTHWTHGRYVVGQNVIECFSNYVVPTELIWFLCVFSTNISFLTELCYAFITAQIGQTPLIGIYRFPPPGIPFVTVDKKGED